MTVQIHSPRHKLIADKGMVLWLPRSPIPDNLANPDIYAESVQQLYPMGAKLEFADGRVFRYGKFGATANSLTLLGRFLANGNLVPGSAATVGYEGSLDATSDVAVGSTTLVLNDTADRSENHYEDGCLTTFPTGHYVTYRIVGNEAAVTVDDVTIYLDDPNGLQTLHVVNSTGVTAYPSMFSNMMNPGNTTHGSTYAPCVGMCLSNSSTALYYAWVQRKGQCWVTPTDYYGDAASQRLGQMHSDGTSALKNSDASQNIGYLSQMTVSGYGDGMVWLQLE